MWQGMASITKHPAGGWRAWVTIAGKRKSKLFKRKGEAQAWVADQSARGDAGFTWYQALKRYEAEITPTKRATTQRWEVLRFPKLREQIPDRPLSDITPDVLGKWRDERMKSVKAGSVLREMSLLSAIFSTAIKEWQWVRDNPVSMVRKPPQPAPRDRLITDDEIDRQCLALGYVGGKPETVSQRVAVAFLFAIETGMRCSEICGIQPKDRIGRVVRLPLTKNGSARDVPLSNEAFRLIQLVDDCFDLLPSQVDALFRKARAAALLSGFTFHDSRHLAAVRLAQKVTALDLARILGHKDLRMTMRYYSETAASIAKRLD
tara:strand:- start:8211 stop:9167 length:957 start_codon:yes stop_codon:yes gene_type:complete